MNPSCCKSPANIEKYVILLRLKQKMHYCFSKREQVVNCFTRPPFTSSLNILNASKWPNFFKLQGRSQGGLRASPIELLPRTAKN